MALHGTARLLPRQEGKHEMQWGQAGQRGTATVSVTKAASPAYLELVGLWVVAGPHPARHGYHSFVISAAHEQSNAGCSNPSNRNLFLCWTSCDGMRGNSLLPGDAARQATQDASWQSQSHTQSVTVVLCSPASFKKVRRTPTSHQHPRPAYLSGYHKYATTHTCRQQRPAPALASAEGCKDTDCSCLAYPSEKHTHLMTSAACAWSSSSLSPASPSEPDSPISSSPASTTPGSCFTT